MIVAGAAAPARADGGTISGTISVVKLSVGSRGAGLDRAVVFIENDAPVGADNAAAGASYRIVQANKTFEPSLLVVPVGATVDFPNDDIVSHNVFSPARGSKFDLGLYKQGTSRSYTFTRPGVVPIFCNIHPQMIAHVVVVPGPHVARPDAAGKFTLRDVPAGKYTLVTWYPWGEPVRMEVQVLSGRRTMASIVLQERRGATGHRNKHDKPYVRY